MAEQQEQLWEFDSVEPGQAGASTVVDITAENIAECARVSLNDHPRYRADDGRSIPMPTMVLSYAPLLRDEIAEANGFRGLGAIQDGPPPDALRQMRKSAGSVR